MAKPRANNPQVLLLEQVLTELGFKGTTRSWTFKEDGRRKVASLHAKDVYAALEIIDWDEIQDTEEESGEEEPQAQMEQ